MTRRTKLWLGVAAVFIAINAAAAGFVAAAGEVLHSATHVALAFLGGYVAWALVRRARRRHLPSVQNTDSRIEYLQRSVDAMALEVERIGEAQRFSDKLRAERGESTPPNQDR